MREERATKQASSDTPCGCPVSISYVYITGHKGRRDTHNTDFLWPTAQMLWLWWVLPGLGELRLPILPRLLVLSALGRILWWEAAWPAA